MARKSTHLFLMEVLGLVVLLVGAEVANWRDDAFLPLPVADTRLTALGKRLAAEAVR